ncbi:MAG: DUF2809 domain-containing protein [Bacteroidota bacterium]
MMLDLKYAIATMLLLATEISIAIFLKTGFIRHTFGDVLVVILVFCFLRSFFPKSKISTITLSISVLLFAFAVEFAQLLNLLDSIGLRDNQLAIIALGSTFHYSDLIAYCIGIAIIYLIDLKI